MPTHTQTAERTPNPTTTVPRTTPKHSCGSQDHPGNRSGHRTVREHCWPNSQYNVGIWRPHQATPRGGEKCRAFPEEELPKRSRFLPHFVTLLLQVKAPLPILMCQCDWSSHPTGPAESAQISTATCPACFQEEHSRSVRITPPHPSPGRGSFATAAQALLAMSAGAMSTGTGLCVRRREGTFFANSLRLPCEG